MSRLMIDEVPTNFDVPNEDLIKHILSVDEEHNLGITFDDAVMFLQDVLAYEDLVNVFLELKTQDQATVINSYLQSYDYIFDLRGIILFLEVYPVRNIYSVVDQEFLADRSIDPDGVRKAMLFSLEEFGALPDSLVMKIYHFNRMALYVDIHGSFIASELSLLYGTDVLSEILDRAIDLKIELSSTNFVRLMKNWSEFRELPLSWALDLCK